MGFVKWFLNRKTYIVIAIIMGLVCVFWLRPYLSNVDTYTHQIRQLDDKRGNVMQLTAACSATSALISALPGDTCTPIAEQLADFSKVFLVIVSVLLAEKYLLNVFGMLGALLATVACAAAVIYNAFPHKKWIYSMIVRLLILALSFATIIPVSVGIMDIVEHTFESSIDDVVNDALESGEALKADVEATAAPTPEPTPEPSPTPEPEKKKKLWDRVTETFDSMGEAVSSVGDAVNNMGETVSGAVTDAFSGVVVSTEEMLDKAEKALGDYVGVIAIMFVTSCLIPVITILLYVCIIKYAFNMDFVAGATVRRLYARLGEKDGQKE